MALKSWSDKLHSDKKMKIKHIDKRFADIPADSNMLIATPMIFDAYIRSIPKGETRTLKAIRHALALDYHAEYTCPVTTGIFVKIVAEAAYEDYLNGTPIDQITPFWRVIDKQSSIVKKLSFDYEFIAKQRLKEGIT